VKSLKERATEYVKKWAPTQASWVDYDLSCWAYIKGAHDMAERILERAKVVTFNFEDGNGGVEIHLFLDDLKHIVMEESK